jgi:hypothetical protein
VAESKQWGLVLAVGLIALASQACVPSVSGQAIAYEPVVGFVPNGSTMTVTPVVSADRRYVRLSVSPFFNTNNGFQNFGIPAAVSGGGSMLAGMNGLIGQGGAGGGGAVGNPMGIETGEPLAGAYPPTGLWNGLDGGTNDVILDPAGLPIPESILEGPAVPAVAQRRSVPAGGSSRTPKNRSLADSKPKTGSEASVPKPDSPKRSAPSRRRKYARVVDPFLEPY